MHHDAIDSSLTASASINILDDFSLLHVFYLYRPFLVDECDLEDVKDFMIGGEGRCVRERWWCKLAHVCQRWRTVILGSTAYLGVSLVCTKGTPVSDVLEHLPPLPLVIDYFLDANDNTAAKDEEGVILALKQDNCLRRVPLGCLPRTSESSSWPWMVNVQFWNTWLSRMRSRTRVRS